MKNINRSKWKIQKGIYLRVLKETDVKQPFVDWFKDKEINKYSGNQFKKFTLKGQKQYVRKINKSNLAEIYGIFNFNNEHIGNITIYNISLFHKNAEITYIIGNKKYWNMGIATSAVKAICKIAKTKFKLFKLYAGCVDLNVGSKKVLLKNGFQIEGIKKKHLCCNGIWMDEIDFGLLLKKF